MPRTRWENNRQSRNAIAGIAALRNHFVLLNGARYSIWYLFSFWLGLRLPEGCRPNYSWVESGRGLVRRSQGSAHVEKIAFLTFDFAVAGQIEADDFPEAARLGLRGNNGCAGPPAPLPQTETLHSRALDKENSI